jgi:hypothetical protein
VYTYMVVVYVHQFSDFLYAFGLLMKV